MQAAPKISHHDTMSTEDRGWADDEAYFAGLLPEEVWALAKVVKTVAGWRCSVGFARRYAMYRYTWSAEESFCKAVARISHRDPLVGQEEQQAIEAAYILLFT
jgi:hypothetical protein